MRGMETGDTDLEEERGQRSRPLGGPGFSRSAGRGGADWEMGVASVAQGKREPAENGRGQWRERGAPEGYE